MLRSSPAAGTNASSTADVPVTNLETEGVFEWPLRVVVPRVDYTVRARHDLSTMRGAMSSIKWQIEAAPHLVMPLELSVVL